MTRTYYQPIPHTVAGQGLPLAGGPIRFSMVLRRSRAGVEVMDAADLPDPIIERLSAPRPSVCGVPMNDGARIMGILNVTPDSFSDGGLFDGPGTARGHATQMAADGADILDIGGESTRPGAEFVPADEEIRRTAGVIAGLRGEAGMPPISIDTRKAEVAAAAIDAGAALFNDVSAFTYDADSLGVAAERGVAVCLMHAAGDPKTMQDKPQYDDVLLDIYDYLDARVAAAEAAGISREKIIVDPGIGFGKTLRHNLDLINNLAIFHGLGCPILFGASRKRFIGTLSGVSEASDRLAGSVAAAVDAARQGAQIIRVHDVLATRQALDVANGIWTGKD